MLVVSLVGQAGSGKDTVAETAIRFFTEHGKKAKRIALADRLYVEVSECFNIPEHKLRNRDTKETPIPELCVERCRNPEFTEILLQDRAPKSTLGRVLQFFRKTLLRCIAKFSPRRAMQLYGTEYRRNADENYFVRIVAANIMAEPDVDFWFIPDVRYANEDRLHPGQTETWRILRDGIPEVSSHSSEGYWKTCKAERDLHNNGTLEEFTKYIYDLLEKNYL